MIAFGYDHQYTFFFKMPKNLPKELKGSATYLICKNICIPGKVEFNSNLKNGSYKFKNQIVVSPEYINKAYSDLPSISQSKDFDIVLKKVPKQENKLQLFYSTPSTNYQSKSHNLIYFFPNELLDFKHEKLNISKNIIKGKMNIDWDGEYTEPPTIFPTNGILKKPLILKYLYYDGLKNKYIISTKLIKEINSSQINEYNSLFTKSVKKNNKITNSSNPNISLLSIILLAFLGGLILNVMPCVLPVISLKLYSLVGSNGSGKRSYSKLRKHNLYYSAGVILTFIFLASIISILKSAGSLVGWGFQLQSPSFVFIMILVLFIFSLNLFGLFEFLTPGGKSLGNISIKDGPLGDLLTGVVATILSTPCSAPFLGTAVSFAFSGSYFQLFMIFIFIGIGLSSPFILIAIFPKMISFLPKPGEWMNTFKKFLGLSMLITSMWLWDIFLNLTDYSLFLPSAIFISILGYFIFLITHKHISTLAKIIALIILMSSFLYLNDSWVNMPETKSSNNSELIKSSTSAKWEKWSFEKMTNIQKSNKLAFVDFSAKWCLTCKVNEKLVLNNNDFSIFVKSKNIKLLMGDWTKRDPEITKFLNKYRIFGVPAYFIVSNGKIINLGETISLSKIKNNFKLK